MRGLVQEARSAEGRTKGQQGLLDECGGISIYGVQYGVLWYLLIKVRLVFLDRASNGKVRCSYGYRCHGGLNRVRTAPKAPWSGAVGACWGLQGWGHQEHDTFSTTAATTEARRHDKMHDIACQNADVRELALHSLSMANMSTRASSPAQINCLRRVIHAYCSITNSESLHDGAVDNVPSIC